MPKVSGHPAIKQYLYRQPALNAKGEVIGLNSNAQPKTTYDPNLISDSEMVRAASRAAQSNKNLIIRSTGEGKTQYDITDDVTGIKFHAYLDTKTRSFLSNIHPQ